jgi:hypothetical protein
MNERTKELAVQAGYTKDMFGIGHWDMPECKKFAELIVAECIGVVNKIVPPGYEDYPDYRDQIEKSFRIECAIEIKKHFGVDE